MRSIENVIGISPNRAMLTGFSSSSSSGSNRLAGGAANGFEDVSVVINELSAYDDDDLEGKIGVLNKFMEYSAVSIVSAWCLCLCLCLLWSVALSGDDATFLMCTD